MPDLRWYQRDALAAWGAANRRGVIALPTGAGKTMVATAAIAACGVSALCLVPTCVLLEQWVNVLMRYVREVGRLGDGERSVASVTVATYASAITWAPRIGDRFGLVVVDEAHHVGAGCPGEVLEMLVAKARLCLTATPPLDDAAVALERHVGPIVYALAIDDLVGDSLADFDLVTIPIRLDRDERARYDAARAVFATAFASFQRVSPGADWQAFARAAMRSQARATAASYLVVLGLIDTRHARAASAKLDTLVEHLAEATETGHKALVFSQFTSFVALLRARLDASGVSYEYLDGQTRDRKQAVTRFNTDPACKVFLISLKAGGTDLNLTSADYVYLLDPWWNPAVEAQAIDRTHRPGQTRPVLAYRLIAQGTVEDKILELQAGKRALAAGIRWRGRAQADASRRRRSISQVLANVSATTMTTRRPVACESVSEAGGAQLSEQPRQPFDFKGQNPRRSSHPDEALEDLLSECQARTRPSIQQARPRQSAGRSPSPRRPRACRR